MTGGGRSARASRCAATRPTTRASSSRSCTRSRARGTDAVHHQPRRLDALQLRLRDALELVRAPIAEVHLSAIESREEWRRHSVIADLAAVRVSGKGAEGISRRCGALARDLVARGGRDGEHDAMAEAWIALPRRCWTSPGLDGAGREPATDVRYLSGFRGETRCSRRARAGARSAPTRASGPQVREEVTGFELVEDGAPTCSPTPLAAAARRLGADGRLGFQGSALSYGEYRGCAACTAAACATCRAA